MVYADWSEIRVDDADNTGQEGAYLEVSYTPEPATMSLLGIGGLLVLVRRKRK